MQCACFAGNRTCCREVSSYDVSCGTGFIWPTRRCRLHSPVPIYSFRHRRLTNLSYSTLFVEECFWPEPRQLGNLRSILFQLVSFYPLLFSAFYVLSTPILLSLVILVLDWILVLPLQVSTTQRDILWEEPRLGSRVPASIPPRSPRTLSAPSSHPCLVRWVSTIPIASSPRPKNTHGLSQASEKYPGVKEPDWQQRGFPAKRETSVELAYYRRPGVIMSFSGKLSWQYIYWI